MNQLPTTARLKSRESINLRYATENDYPVIVQISRRAIPEPSGPSSNWRDLIQRNFVIVAELDDEVVAFGVYQPEYHQSVPDEVEGIYVLPEHQNKGIGSELLGLLEHIAMSRGIRTIYLDSAWGSEQRWLAKGYERVEVEKNTVRMKKDLAKDI